MKYHDYHLRSYSVGDFGATITFDLVFDYPNRPRDESTIQFTDVAVYNFVHTGGAIIIDIIETPLSKISPQTEAELIAWFKQHGGSIDLRENSDGRKERLMKEGYKAWTILSAVGFEGFVIAKNVK